MSEGSKTDLMSSLTGSKGKGMIPPIVLLVIQLLTKKRCYIEIVVLIMGIIVKSETVAFHFCACHRPCHNSKKSQKPLC